MPIESPVGAAEAGTARSPRHTLNSPGPHSSCHWHLMTTTPRSSSQTASLTSLSSMLRPFVMCSLVQEGGNAIGLSYPMGHHDAPIVGLILAMCSIALRRLVQIHAMLLTQRP